MPTHTVNGRMTAYSALMGAYSKFRLQPGSLILAGVVIRHWAVIRSFTVFSFGDSDHANATERTDVELK